VVGLRGVSRRPVHPLAHRRARLLTRPSGRLRTSASLASWPPWPPCSRQRR
jgi:hypothetical protein